MSGAGALRAAGLLSGQVAELLADRYGVCLHPIPMRRKDASGAVELVNIRCGSVLEAKCGPCARRARSLRVQQCREGWYAEQEPPARERRAPDGVLAGQADAGVGSAGELGQGAAGRRSRSTRRRVDMPDLPRRSRVPGTLGRVYVSPDGKRFRPSMFITVTLPGYGPVQRGTGVPVDPSTYDYVRAVRDSVHFSGLVDRLVRNLRRVAGYDLQYFGVIEPQRRGAPHLHLAVRGTMARAEVRAVVAATYHHVWWPSTERVGYRGDRLPVWVSSAGGYCDPVTGEVLPTWGESLDALGEEADPFHVARFGTQMDVRGLLGGEESDRAVRYLTKYLTKSLGGQMSADAGTGRRAAHVARLVAALEFEPCSPSCANWLRYGVQPKDARAGLVPGLCRGRAHQAAHLGYSGRRVRVSRRWSGKTVADHAADRRAWVLATLGVDAAAAGEGAVWVRVPAGDASLPPRAVRLLREVASVQERRARLEVRAGRSGSV
ncbi:replication initiator [Sinosporangium siamense]|uniref:Replication initiation protein n=1 Tax=Sinosporangium siamense TaxID=1367973 RepID=A0A919RR84_9ACTN|nr:replication initiator [Sinosporangium siamense]GII97580.1 hypothetical protein Ssi02_78110 [Sinosporangium siamense]